VNMRPWKAGQKTFLGALAALAPVVFRWFSRAAIALLWSGASFEWMDCSHTKSLNLSRGVLRTTKFWSYDLS
jgi:hypothetical protein